MVRAMSASAVADENIQRRARVSGGLCVPREFVFRIIHVANLLGLEPVTVVEV